MEEITVGAVAYHPRVLTVWEAFREYFREQDAPTDYILYSNYERLVDVLLEEAAGFPHYVQPHGSSPLPTFERG